MQVSAISSPRRAVVSIIEAVVGPTNGEQPFLHRGRFEMVLRRLFILLIVSGLFGPGQLEAQARPPADSITHAGSPLRLYSSDPLPWPPADDRIRSRALLGALLGGASGTVIGLIAPCRGGNEGPPCQLGGAVIGLGAGLYAGSTVGAWAGGGLDRCGYGRGLARSAAGALIGSVPFAAYSVALHKKRIGVGSGVPLFFLAATLPLLQAEGATRAVSGC
jgi:hypothetical protein